MNNIFCIIRKKDKVSFILLWGLVNYARVNEIIYLRICGHDIYRRVGAIKAWF